MNAIKNIVLLLVSLLIIVGCASTELTLQGSKVNIGKEANLKQCQILGSTRLSLSPTRVKLMKEKKMKEQLTVEARNFAARIGGNMILPVGALEEGKQSFKIYNCPLFDN